VTATAVEAYLATAGYAMSRRYRRQFDKLLQFLHSDFLPAVAQKQDGQSVVVKIQVRGSLGGWWVLCHGRFRIVQQEQVDCTQRCWGGGVHCHLAGQGLAMCTISGCWSVWGLAAD
jgi:hypothetical protein